MSKAGAAGLSLLRVVVAQSVERAGQVRAMKMQAPGARPAGHPTGLVLVQMWRRVVDALFPAWHGGGPGDSPNWALAGGGGECWPCDDAHADADADAHAEVEDYQQTGRLYSKKPGVRTTPKNQWSKRKVAFHRSVNPALNIKPRDESVFTFCDTCGMKRMIQHYYEHCIGRCLAGSRKDAKFQNAPAPPTRTSVAKDMGVVVPALSPIVRKRERRVEYYQNERQEAIHIASRFDFSQFFKGAGTGTGTGTGDETETAVVRDGGDGSPGSEQVAPTR